MTNNTTTNTNDTVQTQQSSFDIEEQQIIEGFTKQRLAKALDTKAEYIEASFNENGTLVLSINDNNLQEIECLFDETEA